MSVQLTEIRQKSSTSYTFIMDLSSRRAHHDILTTPVYSFFFNDTATTEIYTLSLHDALPIFNLTIPLQQLNGLETLVIIMVANKYAFLQITRRRFLNEWEAFKKVISRNAYLFATMIIDRKSGSAGMPRPISYAVFCLKKKKNV